MNFQNNKKLYDQSANRSKDEDNAPFITLLPPQDEVFLEASLNDTCSTGEADKCYAASGTTTTDFGSVFPPMEIHSLDRISSEEQSASNDASIDAQEKGEIPQNMENAVQVSKIETPGSSNSGNCSTKLQVNEQNNNAEGCNHDDDCAKPLESQYITEKDHPSEPVIKSVLQENNTPQTSNKNARTATGNPYPSAEQPTDSRYKCLKSIGKLIHTDGKQYIKRRFFGDPDYGILLYAGKFWYGEMEFQLHSDSCLLTSKNKYLARVAIHQVDELDNCISFHEARVALLKHLEIVKVYKDEQQQERDNAESDFKSCLDEMCETTTTNPQSAENLLQLWNIFRQLEKDFNNQNFLLRINKNQYISPRMKTVISQYIDQENKMSARNAFFSTLSNCWRRVDTELFNVLQKTIQKGMATHKTELLAKCPYSIKDVFMKVNTTAILFVTASDLKLFNDIGNALDEHLLKQCLPNIGKRFFSQIASLKHDCLQGVVPITNQIYFFLCKSLIEVVEEIKTFTKIDTSLQYCEIEWKVVNLSSWSPESTVEINLSRQLEMLVKMVNHFEPGKQTAQKPFSYKFQLFQSSKLNQINHQTNQESMHELSNKDIPNEVLVWICLLDHTIVNIFSKDSKNMSMFVNLLSFYESCACSNDFNARLLESLRVTTHNTLRFVAQAAPFILQEHSLDNYILQKQITFMNLAILEHRMAYDESRDLIEVFSTYWKQRNIIISNLPNKLTGDYFENDVEEIQELIFQCVAKALDKKVSSMELTNFFRALDELLIDLNEFEFEWFVRLPQNENIDIFQVKKVLEIVNNKLKDNELKCYQVKDFKRFVALHQVLNADEKDKLPHHYMTSVVKILLEAINSLATKTKWNCQEPLTDSTQVNSMVLLIASIRRSLLYLKEQPDYICFDRFLRESTKPFNIVISESESFEDFSKRILLVKDSFWFIRNHNAIGIDTALYVWLRENFLNLFGTDSIKSGFLKYSDHFERYMRESVGLAHEEKIQRIANSVKDQVVPRLTCEWSKEFKQNTLPSILAGLGAVWAVQISKDVACTGKYLKPNCIQILCVLRLLGVDNEDVGVENHLAEVLTGQGKSLVLGLIASVLALLGHSVTIMCYSDYLARRDANDFEELYRIFSIFSKISYKTFESMAVEQIRCSWEKAENYITEKMQLPLQVGSQYVTLNDSKIGQSVLLIDEVDVFFTDSFYGNTYNLGFHPLIRGLGLIQIKIWELVSQSKTKHLIENEILRYTQDSHHPDMEEFKSFISKEESYSILDDQDGLIEKYFTNNSLYLHHLDQMIYTAIAVYHNSDLNNRFRINADGLLVCRDEFGEYGLNYSGYYNTFNYFRLKQTNFIQSVGAANNFGYFSLRIGSVSYAKLTENYPLILGVTGTLSTMNDHERKVVKEHYQIHKSSIMPSFFGCSNLKFDQRSSFICLPSSTDWLNKIFNRVNMMIEEKRAVLVFFDTDVEINSFKQAFASQLKRVNVLTANTEADAKERYIDDAGEAKTVTLASREMGRGVDYKSSVSVEKNGGLHVIQTFFSLDVKEETQIKGRTARKDNRGSYELIVYLWDLQKVRLVDDGTLHNVQYEQLEKSRKKLAEIDGAKKTRNLLKANAKHCRTGKFTKNL